MARLHASVSAAMVAAVILDLVMAVSILLNSGGAQRPRYAWVAPAREKVQWSFAGGIVSRAEHRASGWMTRFSFLLLAFLALSAGEAGALDQVRFGTNWVAEAEHGGFYQALADGTYKKYGLDVVIVPGGPNTNNPILRAAGVVDFYMSANSLQSFDAVENSIPTVVV